MKRTNGKINKGESISDPGNTRKIHRGTNTKVYKHTTTEMKP